MKNESEVSIEKIVSDYIEDIGEDAILDAIEEIKCEFVDIDWEDFYDSAEEAYDEANNGKAEAQILCVHAQEILGKNASSQEIISYVREMAYQLGLHTSNPSDW